MTIIGRGEMTSTVNPGRPEDGFRGRLGDVARIAVLVGAVGSVGLMLRAGQRSLRLLLVLFTIWVLSPFMALLLGSVASKRWSAATRVTLHGVMLVVALGSLAAYGDDAMGHRRAQAAFVYVVVPAASRRGQAQRLSVSVDECRA